MMNIRKRHFAVVICLIAVICQFDVVAKEEAEKGIYLSDQVIYRIEASSNSIKSDTVTYYDDNGNIYGPESFWIDEEENVYILDSIANRIIMYTDGQLDMSSLEESIKPKDLLVMDQKYYILDTYLDQLQIYDEGNLILNEFIPLDGNYIKRLEVIGGDVAATTYSGENYSISLEQKEWTKSFSASCNESVKYNQEEYSLTEVIGTDFSGNIYSLNTRMVPDTSVIAGEVSILGSSEEGEYLGGYALNSQEFLYLPEHFVRVLDNGDIYIMVPTQEAVEIRKINLQLNMDSKYDSIKNEALQLEVQYNIYRPEERLASASLSLTQQEVLDRANRIAGYGWNLTQNNISAASDVTLPTYIKNIANQYKGQSSWSVRMSGIPYCWGGFYSQYTGNVAGRTFTDAIELGYTAGNVNTTGNLKANTAGLDCSGYVSACYGLSSKYGTGDFLKFGKAVTNSSNLQTMDFFVKDGHIMLFYTWINDSTVLVCETTKADEKTVIHTKSLSELIVEKKYQMRTPW